MLLLGALFTGVVAVLWWGIRAAIQSFRDITHTFTSVAVDIQKLRGFIEQNNQWQDLHEKQDAQRFSDLKEDIRDVKTQVDALHNNN